MQLNFYITRGFSLGQMNKKKSALAIVSGLKPIIPFAIIPRLKPGVNWFSVTKTESATLLSCNLIFYITPGFSLGVDEQSELGFSPGTRAKAHHSLRN